MAITEAGVAKKGLRMVASLSSGFHGRRGKVTSDDV
jgi:hypothetical protein